MRVRKYAGLFMCMGFSVGCDDGVSSPGRLSHVAPPASASAEESAGGRASTQPSLAGVSGSAPLAPLLEPEEGCRWPSVIEPDCAEGFCRIRPGCYIMGTPPGEFFAARYAEPQVQVTLTRAFEIGQTEVTRGQWLETGWDLPIQQPFCESEGCVPDDCLADDCPVNNVSFYDVVSFANHLSVLRGLDPCYALEDCTGETGDGLRCDTMILTRETLFECEGYRLPAESEWEYAARAGTSTTWFTGDIVPRTDGFCYEEPALEPIGWYCNNSGLRLHPVAQKRPNPWGLHDMAGNVHEWVNDIWDSSGYGEGPYTDFAGELLVGRSLTNADSGGNYRSTRGGAANTAAYGAKVNKQLSMRDEAFATVIGFRLARTLDSVGSQGAQ